MCHYIGTIGHTFRDIVKLKLWTKCVPINCNTILKLFCHITHSLLWLSIVIKLCKIRIEVIQHQQQFWKTNRHAIKRKPKGRRPITLNNLPNILHGDISRYSRKTCTKNSKLLYVYIRSTYMFGSYVVWHRTFLCRLPYT